jgi:hypothetical protein
MYSLPVFPALAERSDRDGSLCCELSGAEGDATSLSLVGAAAPQALWPQPPACVVKMSCRVLPAWCAGARAMLES